MMKRLAIIYEAVSIVKQFEEDGYTWKHQTPSYIFFEKDGRMWRVDRKCQILEARVNNSWRLACPVVIYGKINQIIGRKHTCWL
ncbi:hypothetical protein ABES02_28565 [Neobacillus pocheonensis]|uniref:hypothetical protein n=1 Tax=Neobacillus pocheonensis TaxID=363869 RepID=UPI003D2B9B05